MPSPPISEQETAVLKLYTQLMRATNTVTERMHRHLRTHRLSISQFGVLEALYHLGAMCQKDIGNKILKTSGNITLVIDNLEKRKLVQRKRDPQDRRRMTVQLTPKASQLMQTLFPGHARTARAVFSALAPEEQAALGRLLKKLGTYQ